jgi:hypothetical protein
MGNLKNYNFNKIDAFLSNYQYHDYYLALDGCATVPYTGSVTGDCFVVDYDFNDPNIYSTGSTSADTIYSLVTWTGATNSGYTFNTFGLTGIDNGYITFDKTTGDTANTALLSALTATTIVIPSGETRLTLNRVTGMTENYEYPIDILSGTSGDYAKLCGGFYQGYYKLDGYDYQVLPDRVEKGWVSEFWLRKSDLNCSGYTGTTLNDTYPDNKGFFFYMGTRAENKFWNIFEGLNTGCTSGCTSSSACTGTVTTFCTIPKETEIAISGDSGYPIRLSPPPLKITEYDNQFLLYGRAGNNNKCGTCGSTSSGFGTLTACDSATTITITGYTTEVTNEQNPFLIYGRAGNNGKCGTCGATNSGFGNETVCTFSGFTSVLDELDKDIDVIDNAIGFRIKDDGSIGYRSLKLTGSCINEIYTTGVTIEEDYSVSGVVTDDQWHMVSIRFSLDEDIPEDELDCAPLRIGRLMFYVDGKLKHTVDDVDEFVARRLNEYKDKQLGVPFNISLGGGSQGLLESMTFDGQDPDDLGLNIEQNFAGTFIGDISQFRFYICDLNWIDINNHYNIDKDRYT